MNKFNNFFTDKERFRTIDKFRIIYFYLFLISFGITEFGRKIYRPFIRESDINDFGIADSIGNLGGIVAQIFFALAILNPPRHKIFRVIALLSFGYILYEVLQPYLPRGVFDWKDVWGTFIGGVIALFLFLLVQKVFKNKKIFKL
ncbi:hypothetical protein KKA15_01865 [Patescibacteria group bacterium]|nr:hypothetical protein [Patescibacteria group bacterium]